MASLDHRNEIEGLRAIAVLGVVAFHIEIAAVSGGFVGVDIFFVISGFLIARIILHDLKAGSFSLTEFYARRARRILPALLAVVLVTFLIGSVVLFPTELVLLAQSTIATIFFVPNFFFWFESGYFGPRANELPLLHMWSIGVEEQFYLLFPVSLLLLFRYGRNALPIAIPCGLLLSLSLGAWAAAKFPVAAFYLIPFRAWELLLGASLTVLPLRACGKVLGNIFFFVGLGLIAFAYRYFDKSIAIPGLPALVPCAGAALIIYSGPAARDLASLLLANQPLIWLGKASYSIYLWHWPAIVLIDQVYKPVKTLSWGEIAAYFVCLIVLSFASYAWIESPFRNLRGGSARAKFASLAGLAALVMILSAGCIATDGFPIRLPANKQAIAPYLTPQFTYDPVPRRCLFFVEDFTTDQFLKSNCVQSDSSRPTMLFWGDSVAAFQVPGMRREAQAAGINLIQATMAACGPTLELVSGKRCALFTSFVRDLIAQRKPDLVVLSAAWNTEDELTELTHRHVYERALELAYETARQGIAVAVLGPPVQYLAKLPVTLLKASIASYDDFDATPFLYPPAWVVDKDMQAEAKRLPGIHYISVIDATCPDGKCKVTFDGAPMTWDTHHLTMAGSIYLAQHIFPRLLEILKGERRKIAR